MDEGVAPSRLGKQPIGEVARVAEDVWQLKLPVPLSLCFVSVYLVEGNNGWTLVDSGYNYPPTYELWEAGAATLGATSAVTWPGSSSHISTRTTSEAREGCRSVRGRQFTCWRRSPFRGGSRESSRVRSRSSSIWSGTACRARQPNLPPLR
jgi:hypothetical protein